MTTNALHMQISPGSNFADAFWDDNFKGVDIIFNRLKRSKETCEEIKRLYESRAQIEQEYGERLLKLAATSRVGEHEEGSFAETLSRIPSTLETTGRAHIDLAQQLRDHLEIPLDGFLKEQREIRKSQHTQIENLRQLKNLHEAEVARAREYYSNESTKLMSLEKHFTVEMEKEIEEQRKLVTIAEQVYRRAVDNLNAVNERWICDWKHSADIHQEMEVKRITYLRSTLWTFANMLTSTFNIDEECCDRIRAALEITDVQKDITDFVQCHRTGSKLPSPIPYESFYKPVKREIYSQQPSKESLTHSVTVLTNPDEELKSVDHQLQQLEQLQTPRLEPANDPPLTGATVSTHSHVSSAMKEVEQMLNQTHDSPNTENYNLAVHESTDGFSADICNALGIKETQDATSKNGAVSPSPSQRSKESGIKYKPMPNPSFTSTQSEHVETDERPESETQPESNKPEIQPEPKKEDDDDDDKEIEEYQSRMPRPPPKDEKWVISSIRRPQQVPIKTPNHEEVPRSNTESLSHHVSPAEDNKGHQPKVHKPVVPLTIEIPNPVNPTKLPQLAAHQVIEDARRHSQMSPANIEMNRQQNRDDNGGIRPAPWQDNGIMHPDDKKGYMPNMNGQYPPPNGYHAYHSPEHINSHPRGSSLAMLPNHQDFLPPQHAAYPEEETNKKRSSKNKAEATGKSGKESKGAGRFSLFFTGNKKDKKKEKENQQQIQPYMLDHQQRPQSHYQTLTKEPVEKDVFYNNPPVSAPMPHTATNGSHKFICYVKAQWPFEATIEGEMSFSQDEVLGILHKQSDGWWQAERLSGEAAGQRGLVPGNYMVDAPY